MNIFVFSSFIFFPLYLIFVVDNLEILFQTIEDVQLKFQVLECIHDGSPPCECEELGGILLCPHFIVSHELLAVIIIKMFVPSTCLRVVCTPS